MTRYSVQYLHESQAINQERLYLNLKEIFESKVRLNEQ